MRPPRKSTLLAMHLSRPLHTRNNSERRALASWYSVLCHSLRRCKHCGPKITHQITTSLPSRSLISCIPDPMQRYWINKWTWIAIMLKFVTWEKKMFFFSLQIKDYRSVDDFTSSCFHRPHMSCRVVDANRHIFTNNSNPMGPKKYTNISMSPKIEEVKMPIFTMLSTSLLFSSRFSLSLAFHVIFILR